MKLIKWIIKLILLAIGIGIMAVFVYLGFKIKELFGL